MDNIKELRDLVEATIGPFLGTYTFDSGQAPVPAISLLVEDNAGIQAPPAGSQVNGTEAVIIRGQSNYKPLHAGFVRESYMWEVWLKFWEVETQAQEIINLLINAVAQTNLTLKKVTGIPRSEDTGNIQQTKILYTQEVIQKIA